MSNPEDLLEKFMKSNFVDWDKFIENEKECKVKEDLGGEISSGPINTSTDIPQDLVPEIIPKKKKPEIVTV